MKGSTGRLVIVVVGLAAIGVLAAWKFGVLPRWKFWQADAQGDGQNADTPDERKKADGAQAQATKAYKQGLALYNAGKALDARRTLSQAFFSGHLTGDQEKMLLPIMTELADQTLLQGRFYDGDPYVLRLFVESGDTLSKLAEDKDLRVPWQLLIKINNLPPNGQVKANTSIMAVQGPFHALVSKSRFTMDIYLHRQPLPKVFVRRFRVGLGSEGHETPQGRWQVTKGGKQDKAPWYPPLGSPLHGKVVIRFGDAGYPLGKKGYWIPLTGLDDENRQIKGIAIHGTSDPSSVGKAQSLGCLRLLDEDVEWAFAMLYEVHSTVTVLP